MRKMIVVGILLMFASPALAVDFTASYDNYTTPNVSNNYDDGRGVSLGLKHNIWKDIKGHIQATHISDIDFPTQADPKGSFGELRGYGAIYNLIYDLRYDENLVFNMYVGVGPVWWQFRNNPYLQDAHATSKVDPSIVMKIGAGLEYKLRDDWNFSLNVGWSDTQIGKKITSPDGVEMEILDADGQIGLQYFTWSVGIKRKF